MGINATESGVRLTLRLRLVPIASEHFGELRRLQHDPGVSQWNGGPWNEAKIVGFGASAEYGWLKRGVHNWMAFRRHGARELLGMGGLCYAEVGGREQLQLAWSLFECYWGQGFATEIGQAGLDLAFGQLDAREVVAFTEPENHRSRAVMERLGLHYVRDIVYGHQICVLYSVSRGHT